MKLSVSKRICLWSGPRNISTALMYSFAQRSDTKVYDEPLYAYYLSHTEADEYHPGADKVLASQENDGDKVIAMMLSADEKPVLFFKNMAHHLLDLDRSFMKETINVILTRDPVDMLPSFAKVIEHPTIDDVGYKLQADLADELHRRQWPLVVLEARAILMDPKIELTRLCHAADISFDESMLQWTAGPRPEDGIWSEYWYDSVHRSTGFGQYQPKNSPFPDRLKPLLNKCLPYYAQLRELGEKSRQPDRS